jgi:hypothetical protein
MKKNKYNPYMTYGERLKRLSVSQPKRYRLPTVRNFETGTTMIFPIRKDRKTFEIFCKYFFLVKDEDQ